MPLIIFFITLFLLVFFIEGKEGVKTLFYFLQSLVRFFLYYQQKLSLYFWSRKKLVFCFAILSFCAILFFVYFTLYADIYIHAQFYFYFFVLFQIFFIMLEIYIFCLLIKFLPIYIDLSEIFILDLKIISFKVPASKVFKFLKYISLCSLFLFVCFNLIFFLSFTLPKLFFGLDYRSYMQNLISLQVHGFSCDSEKLFSASLKFFEDLEANYSYSEMLLVKQEFFIDQSITKENLQFLLKIYKKPGIIFASSAYFYW